jgi:hypothetical protein
MSNDNTPNDPMNFVKNMWGNMGFTLPGMVTPSFDVEEIEKQVKDLKAVEGWLKMNLSMLQMTIQNLEMQCVTLNTMRTMSEMVGNPPPSAAGESETSNEGSDSAHTQASQASMWPWNLMQQMQEKAQQAAAEQTATPAEKQKTTRKQPKKTP